MTIALTETERARLARIARRPRSRKQGYRARAILDLGAGQTIEAVARACGVGIDRVEAWVEGYRRLGLRYLQEDPPRSRDDVEDDELL